MITYTHTTPACLVSDDMAFQKGEPMDDPPVPGCLVFLPP